jgi:hypothetical protein
MTAHCIECRRPLSLFDLTYETEDGELCEDCDGSYPPQLRPSLGYVPALLASINRGETSPPEQWTTQCRGKTHPARHVRAPIHRAWRPS